MDRLYFFKYSTESDTNNLYSHAAISGEQTLDHYYVHVEQSAATTFTVRDQLRHKMKRTKPMYMYKTQLVIRVKQRSEASERAPTV